MKYTLAHALNQLCPDAKWVVRETDDGKEYLEWMDENVSRPSDAEIEKVVNDLKKQYDLSAYQRLRQAEYPSYADQFDLLYHGGYDAWKEQITKIKDKYPKPQ